MPSDEYARWQIYEEFDPFGRDRLDLLAGIVASLLANQWRGKDTQPVTPDDLIPDWGGLRQQFKAEEGEEQERRNLEAWLARVGGDDQDDEEGE